MQKTYLSDLLMKKHTKSQKVCNKQSMCSEQYFLFSSSERPRRGELKRAGLTSTRFFVSVSLGNAALCYVLFNFSKDNVTFVACN